MSNYDYSSGKKRIEEILNSPNETERSDRIPSQSQFSFDNGFYGYVTSVFVDIRDSTSLFAESSNKKTTIAKVIRSFTSEVIEILRDDENLREIGVRGDCVYAIYTSPGYKNDYEIFDKVAYINTFSSMLNDILKKRQFPTIAFGIGVASSNDLVVKAGRAGVGINGLVWIGKAVSYASHLSNLANKEGNSPILISEEFYDNLLKAMEKDNPYGINQAWFSDFFSEGIRGKGCSVIKTAMSEWIENGMK